MNPIDIDTSGKRFIQSVSTPSKTTKPNITDAAHAAPKTSTDQLADLMRLIHNTPDKVGGNERLRQVMHDLNMDTYTIDLDALADNIAKDLFQD